MPPHDLMIVFAFTLSPSFFVTLSLSLFCARSLSLSGENGRCSFGIHEDMHSMIATEWSVGRSVYVFGRRPLVFWSGRTLFYYISSPFTVFLLFLCLFYRFFAFFMRCVFLIGTGWELNEMGRSCLCEGVTPPPRTHPLCCFCSVFVLLILCEQFLFSQLQSIVALFDFVVNAVLYRDSC